MKIYERSLQAPLSPPPPPAFASPLEHQIFTISPNGEVSRRLTRNWQTRSNCSFFPKFHYLPMRSLLLKQILKTSSSWFTSHPCNHAFAVENFRRFTPCRPNFPYPNLDGYGVHIESVKFSTEPVKNLTSRSILVFDFERLGVHIFVLLALFRVNRTPECTRNFRPLEISSGSVWTKPRRVNFSYG